MRGPQSALAMLLSGLPFNDDTCASGFAWRERRTTEGPTPLLCLIAIATIVERGPIASTCAADVSGDQPQKRRAAGLEASRQ
jgi:hypothetical protein